MGTEEAQNGTSQPGDHRRQHQIRGLSTQTWKVWLQPEQYPHFCLVNLKGFAFLFGFGF